MADLVAPADPRALIDIAVRPEADAFPMFEGDAFLDLAIATTGNWTRSSLTSMARSARAATAMPLAAGSGSSRGASRCRPRPTGFGGSSSAT
jgi:hypothetical protein